MPNDTITMERDPQLNQVQNQVQQEQEIHENSHNVFENLVRENPQTEGMIALGTFLNDIQERVSGEQQEALREGKIITEDEAAETAYVATLAGAKSFFEENHKENEESEPNNPVAVSEDEAIVEVWRISKNHINSKVAKRVEQVESERGPLSNDQKQNLEKACYDYAEQEMRSGVNSNRNGSGSLQNNVKEQNDNKGQKQGQQKQASSERQKIDSSDDGHEKSSLRDKFLNLRPVKALTEAKAAYDLKARRQRDLNALTPEDAGYTEKEKKAKEAAEVFKTKRNSAIGATAVSGAIAGVLGATTDKVGIIPLMDSDASLHEVRGLAIGSIVGAGLGALSVWREKRAVSEQERNELLAFKVAEIDAYRADKPDGYNFDDDVELQKLYRDKEELTNTGLKDRISTKWAEWNIHALNAPTFLQKTKDKLFYKDGDVTKETDVYQDEDVLEAQYRLYSRLETLKHNVPEDQWESNSTIVAAQRELDEFNANMDGHEPEYERVVSRGKIAAAGIGILAVAAGVLYLNKYGFDLPTNDRKSGNMLNEPLFDGDAGRRGNGSSTAENMPQGAGNGRGTSADMLTAQEVWDRLPEQQQEAFTLGERAVATKHPRGSQEYFDLLNNTLKLAVKRDEFINGDGNFSDAERWYRTVEFDQNFKNLVESSAS